MKTFKGYILMATGFAVLVAVVSGITAGPAIAAAVKAALIQNVDEPGRTPYSARVSCTGSGGSCFASASAPVPAGYRLVIEYVSAGWNSPGTFLELELGSLDAGNIAFSPVAYLPPTLLPSTGGNNGYVFYVANQSLRAYVEAGSTPSVLIAQNTSGVVFLDGYVSGYLVNLNN
jgi:hypothetical protein